ncbi:MAG TPA: carboxypeptidase-like regulatory domain-containing protein [Thermoanaerobaculia bacterium]
MTAIQTCRCALSFADPRGRLVAGVVAWSLFLGSSAAVAAVPASEGAPPSAGSAVLAGTVRDSAGAPVAGAKVRIRNYHTGDGWLDGTTDGQGRFRLEGSEPGDYLVWVALGDLILTDSEVIPLAAGVNHHDLLCPRREIRGRVVSAARQPLAGARVVFNCGGGCSATRELRTGADGTFSFLVLDGWFALFVDAPGFRPQRLIPPLRIHGSSRSVELRLRPLAPGRAGSVAIGGRVTGLSPAELKTAKVAAEPMESGPAPGAWRGATLDASGYYRLEGVEPAGVWGLTVEAGSKTIAQRVNVPAGPSGSETLTVDVAFPRYFTVSGRVRNADGSPSDFGRITFDDARQASAQTTGIESDGNFTILLPSGAYLAAADYVTSEIPSPSRLAKGPVVVDGKPLAGVEIRLDAAGVIAGRILGAAADARLQEMTVRAEQGRLAQGGRVDESGHYEIRGLPPGPWQVMAWSGTGDIAGAKVTLLADPAPRAVLDVSFAPGTLTLSGRLTGFDPAANYGLRIEREDEPLAEHLVGVDRDGTFSLSGLAPGKYHVEVEDGGMPLNIHWPLWAGTVDLESDRSLTLPVALPP